MSGKFFIVPVVKYTPSEVRNIRLSLELTQYEFAYLMGVSQNTVESWESGRSKPHGSACRILSMIKADIELPAKYNIIQKIMTERRNSDKMSGSAIILVSFGTSHNSAREKTINVLEADIKRDYSGYDVFTVFTSPTIRRILKNRDNIVYNDLETMFGILKDRGYKNVICQPTYIIKGFEYDNMRLTAEKYANDFDSVKIGLPLLSDIEDYNEVIDALSIDSDDEAYVLIGHGTAHEANMTYAALEDRFRKRGYGNVYISTIEGDQDIRVIYKTVNLIPLMFVAGDHAVNDIAGDKADSYKSVFKQSGCSVRIVLKGLGEYETIRKIYLKHINRSIN